MLLFAASCGAVVANLYISQPLIGLIGRSLGLAPAASGLLVTFTQLGYGAGLVLLVPLGDIVENRRLIAVTLLADAAALILAAVAPSAAPFLAASLAIGVASVAAQMLVPLAAQLAPEAHRGRVVGNVMSGLLFGILLARPVASLLAQAFGWRATFGCAAAAMLGLAALLSRALPRQRPEARESYGSLLRSLWALLRSTPMLRRRAAYQATMFAAFSLFWTAVPLLLAGRPFRYSQLGIGLFALAGVGGALIAPVAGRLADRGWARPATGLAMLAVLVASGLALLGARGSVAVLAAAAILLDAGVQCCQVVGLRDIYALAPGQRSRLNGLFIALFFLGGAAGSAIAGPLLAAGWGAVAALLAAFPLLGLALYATEFRRR